MLSTLYTNGVIAVREKLLLGDKLLRFPEMTAEEVLRALGESGFGDGEQDGESACRAEEEALDAFIREYAPSREELVYFLAPRDFHNAKALCKAKKLGTSAEDLLAPEGLVPIAQLSRAVESGDCTGLCRELAETIPAALGEDVGGAELGVRFLNAQNSFLLRSLKLRKVLRDLIAERTDRTNILTCFRAQTFERAKPLLVTGGKLTEERLSKLFLSDMGASDALKGTPYEAFFGLCARAKESRLPYTEAERAVESSEAEYFVRRRFELEGKEPFLYYVFRRRAEIANVRIILVCLNAGMPSYDIKKRLRALP